MNNFSASKLARDDLKDMEPYVPQQYPGMIRLDANENPYDLPREVKDDINEKLYSHYFNRYPDPLANNLVKALASYTGFSEDYILAGNGSDEIILDLALTFAAGGKVIITSPTFSMYEVHSRVAGAEPVFIPRKSCFSIDIEKIKNYEQDTDTRIIFICSPNNPTANEIKHEELEQILNSVNCLVVVDEAYIEFGGKTTAVLLRKYPNMVVIRSFSKSFGLAGLRVGYLLANPEVIRQVCRVKQPFNLNTYSQLAAVTVLENLSLYQDIIENIKAEREYLLNKMKNLNIKVYPTVTNFILFEPSCDAAKVHSELLEHNILIRNVSSPVVENCLRVSVGTRDENNAFIKALVKAAG
ncbi:MAG: histidinol-phosphate transaminase [Clostridiales bacterium]|nr:histidinol-phosphate transaminase [Clostridiales bacterium]MCF8021679.1 histidinol-phosphate transaminase [Clostridiales bacterium]